MECETAEDYFSSFIYLKNGLLIEKPCESGRLIRLIKKNRPDIEAVSLDVSPTMLKVARDHFTNDSKVKALRL